MGISPEAIQSLLCDQAASSGPYPKPVRAETETKKADTFGPMGVDFFRDMVENAAIGVFVTSSTGRALLFNRQMASILGADSSQDAISFYQDLFTHLYVDPNTGKNFCNGFGKRVSWKDLHTKH
jgi:PAS domain-containing protein